MLGMFFKKKESGLAKKCREYLDAGPPSHMDDYVPESLTEIIIAHGAQNQKLDGEILEIAGIILMESEDLANIEDQAIREYMVTGAQLVEEVINQQ